MLGFLNINKPHGATSRDAVSRVQRLVKPLKVGHAGTLDPLATGVLVIAIGQATRLIDEAQKLGKGYRAEFRFGQSSPGDDLESEVTHHTDLPLPTREQIEANLSQFIGDILQRPPAFSAIKVKGKRAYQLARSGKEVELQARPVRIDELHVVSYKPPTLTLDIHCGSGTYIRSLGRDLAASLGTFAVMSALTRTAVGPFELEDAMELEHLSIESFASHLASPLTVLPTMKRVKVEADAIEQLRLGRVCRVDNSSIDSKELNEEPIAAIDHEGALIAIGEWKSDQQLFQPRKLFISPKQ